MTTEEEMCGGCVLEVSGSFSGFSGDVFLLWMLMFKNV